MHPRSSSSPAARRSFSRSALLLGWLTPLLALGQDPTPTAREPNVLLLVDTSGSMEYKAGSNQYPACFPDGSGVSEKSRWVDVIEVLTGSITDYRCQSIDRRGSSFKTEYTLPDGSTLPPDADYRNPYHRPLSGSCAIGPGHTAAPANAFDWMAPSYHSYTSTSTPCVISGGGDPFLQAPDGLITSLGDIMRFGLMTFDTLPGSSRGYDAGYSPLYGQGAEGAWSYFLSAPSSGHPVDCITPQTLEVGARNGAAPPWEGKMIAFGNPNASITENLARHDKIRQVLLTTRPYGATPIAGMLHDARDFLWNDSSTDPLNASLKYAPLGSGNDKGDLYVAGGCRQQAVILLTDGEPNLDMRTACEARTSRPSGGMDGICPFDTPEDIARNLATSAINPPVNTYVVGFAAETTAGGLNCKDLTSADLSESDGLCATQPNDAALQVCCKLHRIAYAGGTNTAYFASDKNALRERLSEIVNEILDSSIRSATQPVRSPGVGSQQDGGVVAFRLFSSYQPLGSQQAGLFRGNIERLRWTCSSGGTVPAEQEKDATQGDDFTANVNNSRDTRRYVTFQPTPVGGVYHSDRSLRPNTPSVDDGVGTLTGEAIDQVGSGLVSALNAGALRPDTSAGSACAGLTPEACRDRVLRWTLGFDNGTQYSRCPNGNCELVGDVMHSTPVVVDRPRAAVQDETYELFAENKGSRPMMVYTSTNDGFLHGFQLSPNRAEDVLTPPNANNELFAFLPPAVLPLLQSQYPRTRQKLLDGVAVVQDVVAESDTSNTYYPFRLHRTASSAGNPTGNSTWRTILVQSFGGARGGYFALDVTEPKATEARLGPRFLWQLTTDANGRPLFGQGGGTPIITTVFLAGHEVAVAILPGGYGGNALAGTCARSQTSWPSIPGSDYSPRARVHCYDFDRTNDGPTGDDNLTYVGARSLTVVRLDNGEIIKTFRRAAGEFAAAPAGVVVASPLDSPITGIPAAYPAGPGAVSDRVFVGDQDGGLWRVDLSSSSADDWKMELFFDTFSRHSQATNAEIAARAGRPIAVAPALSVDLMGQITIAVGTGDQGLSGDAGEEQFFWSLREKLSDTGTFVADVNWFERLQDGEHILGPISLVNEVLYFSTWRPAGSSASAAQIACGQNNSAVYGLHYLNPATLGEPSSGGLGRLTLASTDPDEPPTPTKTLTAAQMLGAEFANVLIFGMSIEFTPTCYDQSTGADNYIGGNRTSLTRPSSSQMQMVFQTGGIKYSGTQLRFDTGFAAVNLASPAIASTIESWAAILD